MRPGRVALGIAWLVAAGACLRQPNTYTGDPSDFTPDGQAPGRTRSDGATTPSDGPQLDANQVIDAEQPDGGCGTPGRTCLGDRLDVCDPGGALASTMCANGCDPARLECFQCRPNGRTCTGSTLVVCNAEGTGTSTMPCTSGCDPAGTECRECQPGAVWCAGDVLRECTPEGTPRDRQVCGQGCNGARMACNACAPGSKTCAGSTLRTCRGDGSGYSDESCASGCSGDRCNACTPDQRSCDGNSVRQCRSDGSGSQVTPCGRGCAAGACCTGNNEARGGSCSACGGNNQPCCEIASPSCRDDLSCQSGRCVVPCGPGDGQCPSGCSFDRDRDCPKPNGQSCGGDGECDSDNCTGGVCCAGNRVGCNGVCCGSGEVCRANACRSSSCGAENSPCCGDGCDPGLRCAGIANGSRCLPQCGGSFQQCCLSGSACTCNEEVVRPLENGLCDPDEFCGNPGAPCCYRSTCNNGNCRDGVCPLP